MGRPSLYSDELADRLCGELAEGRSLRRICEEEWAPSLATVMVWLNDKPDFQSKYARAHEVQAAVMGGDLLEIADDGRNDFVASIASADPTDLKAAAYAVNPEHIQRSKLRVETRKWLMERMAPKKYGTKVTQELVGADGGPIETRNVHEASTDTLRAIVARALARRAAGADTAGGSGGDRAADPGGSED